MSKYRGTHGYSPNFGYDLLADRSTEEQRAELDLSRVQVLVNGAEPVRRHTIEKFNAAFAAAGLNPNSHTPAYGLAESTVLVSGTTPDKPCEVIAVKARRSRGIECLEATRAHDDGQHVHKGGDDDCFGQLDIDRRCRCSRSCLGRS